LTVRFRVGGERFKPLQERHSRKLKKWLQLAGVVPWMRARIPLLYRDSALVAVGDLWLSDEVREVEAGGPAWRVDWSDHPPVN
jgi:tRNA(Ile)-lysidine synthase